MNQEFSEILADVKEQILYLQELGVENLDVELTDIPDFKFQTSMPAPKPEISPEKIERFVPTEEILKKTSEPPKVSHIEQNRTRRSLLESTKLSRLPSIPKRDSLFTNNLEQRGKPEMPKQKTVEAEDLSQSLFGDISQTLPESKETIEEIRADIGNCTRCPLHEGRTKIVHTTGNFNADLLFVGEAPGANEDAEGVPFVGRAGQLLNKIIEAIGLKREDVYLTNVVKFISAGDELTPDIIKFFTPYLIREILAIKPKVIISLGNTPTKALLNTKKSITQMRGEFYDFNGIKLMPTFNPAYLLRDATKKREVWEDMKMIRAFLDENA